MRMVPTVFTQPFPETAQPRTAPGFPVLLNLLVFSLCLTILYQGMRGIMYLGGFVASGGPYAIAHPAPGWVWIIPISVILVIITIFIGIGQGVKAGGPNLMFLSWSALFLALGWNFLAFGLGLPTDGKAVIGWLICALLFLPMGAIPLWIILTSFFRDWGKKRTAGSSLPWVFLWMQLLCAAAGIYLGIVLFRAISQSPAN